MARLSVSVVIPTYNRARLISRAIESALAAVGEGDEILVVDDESTDDTRAVVSRYPAPVRLIAATHGGAGAARNRGVADANGDLVAFLDSDDEWLPHKIALQRGLMGARSDVLYCFGDFRVQDRSGRVFARYLKHWHNDPRPWDVILGPAVRYSALADLPDSCEDFNLHIGDMYPLLMERLYIGTFTLVFRRDVPGGVPLFPTDLPTYEDWQFFGKLARCGLGAYMDRELATQHGHRMPRLTDASLLVQKETRLKVLARVWGSDAEFMARNGARYNAIVNEQESARVLLRALELLKAGRMSEARAAFAALEAYPWHYRLLLRLPGRAILAGRWCLRCLRAVIPAH